MVKCPVCGQEFSTQEEHDKHHQEVHAGVDQEQTKDFLDEAGDKLQEAGNKIEDVSEDVADKGEDAVDKVT